MKIPYSLLILLLPVALAACSDSHGSTPPAAGVASAPTAVEQYAAVAKGRMDLEGGLVRLAAAREGVIRAVEVEEGAEVKKGQLLAVIDDQSAQMNRAVAQRELEQAQAALPVLRLRLATAQREVARLEKLLPLEATPRSTYDTARDQAAVAAAEIEQAQAAVETARSRLQVAKYEVEQRRVLAPLDGVIVKRLARVGDGVSTLNVTPLFYFAPNTPRIVRAELEERYVSHVQAGMTAVIASEANEALTFPARVLRIGRVFNQRTPGDDPGERVDVRTVEMVLQPTDAKADSQLLVGQRVLVKINRS